MTTALQADELLARGVLQPMPSVTYRVLQLGNGWYPEQRGGSENHYWNLLPQLRRHGFDVFGVVPGSPMAERDTAGRVRSYDPTGLSLLQRGLAIRRVARPAFDAGVDAVGAHFALYALPLLDRIRRQPFVMHFHGPWATEGQAEGDNPAAVAIKRRLEMLVYRRANRVIVHTDAFARILREQYGVPGDIIRRVPGGVDCDRFDVGTSRSEARHILGWEQHRPVLVTVRRLVRRMGIGRLIEAMQASRYADAVLYIVGKGPERAALEAQVTDLGLEQRIRFTGPLADELLPLAYRAADLAVVPTDTLEGFGLVAAEALAAGTPTLVTPVGGLPEVVSGLSAMLVLGGKDAVAIARGIDEALASAARLPDAARCAAYARAHFDWRHVGDRAVSVYRELLG